MPTVGVLGQGRFGRALNELFRAAGIRVRAFDPRAEVAPEARVGSVEDLAAESELIALAVPVTAIPEALRTLAPALSANHVVFDVGSVKVRPTEYLSRALGNRVPWVASHPLFGPASLARGERPLEVVLCPNALHPDAYDRVKALYARIGCTIVTLDPEAHDRAMAETHALAFFIAKGLIDLGAGTTVPFAPPSFRAIERTIEAVRADAGHLFYAIERENPFAADARRRLLDALANVHEQLEIEAPKGSGEPMEIPGLGVQADHPRGTS